MTTEFDPYHKWLGIPPGYRPPTHYQLLGIALYERDPEVIEEAAIRQTAHLRNYQKGPHAAICARVLAEVAQARATLLDPARRAQYETALAQALAAMHAQAAAAATAPSNPEFIVASEATDLSTEVDFASSRRRSSSGGNGLALAAAGAVTLAVIGLGAVLLLRKPEKDRDTVERPVSKPEQPKQPPRKTERAPGDPSAKPLVKAVKVATPTAPPQEMDGAKIYKGHDESIVGVSISADGKRFASAAQERSVLVWDVEKGSPIARLSLLTPAAGVALLPDGKRLVVADETEAILVDVATGNIEHRFNGHQGLMRGLALSADGRKLLTAATDGTIRLWNTSDGAGLLAKEVHRNEPVTACALSADGVVAAAGCNDGSLSVWNLQTNNRVRIAAPDLKGPPTAVALSPNGRKVLAAEGNGALKMWDTTTGKLLRQLAGHSGVVNSARFLADGRRAMTAGSDGAIRIWDTDTGKPLATLPLGGKVYAAALSADESFVLAGGASKMLIAKPLPNDTMAGIPQPTDSPVGEMASAAIPDEKTQADAAAKLKARFAADYAKTKPDELASLAGKLVKVGADLQEPAGVRFVALREGRDLAAKAGNARLALQAIDEMDRQFAEVDSLADKAAALTVAAQTVEDLPARTVADVALSLVGEAADAEKFDIADQLIAAAETAGKAAKTPAVEAKIAARKKELEEAKAVADKAAKAAEAIKANPNDMAAHTTLGRYLCLVKGEWDEGLTHLTEGDDGALKDLAKKDADGPKTAAELTAVADGWWAIGENEPERNKARARQRSRMFYEQAYAELTGPAKAQAEVRIKQAGGNPASLATAARKPGDPVSWQAYNTIRGEARVNSLWTIQGSTRVERIGVRFTTDAKLLSKFQLLDKARVIFTYIPDGHQVSVEWCGETINLRAARVSGPHSLLVERKGRSVSYRLLVNGRPTTTNTIMISEDAARDPSAISFGAEKPDAGGSGFLLQSVIVTGMVKPADDSMVGP